MTWILAYIVALGLCLLFNYCAGQLNQEAAARLGEDYYGE